MVNTLEATINKIFYNVQFNKTCHQKNIKLLLEMYDENNFDRFWESFVSCLRIPLCTSQRHLHVENTLEFVAKFAVTFSSLSDNISVESMSPLLTKIFDFLLSNHNAKDPAVRFRICHCLNLLLNSMGEDAFIDDNLCDRITFSMMNRLLDKNSKVRAQAVFALHRLQDPLDEQCPVIKVYSFHANKDSKAEVRRAVLACMAKNQKTLQVALKRTRDVDTIVRKMAYDFISKITVRSLTIKQRGQLLHDGLKDRSEIVRTCVKNTLLPAWLRHFNKEYISLVRALDAEIGTDSAVSALNTLFKNTDLKTLQDQLPIDKSTKLISIDMLSSENVLYWKCFIKYLYNLSCTDEIETILPELSNFTEYINQYLVMISAKEYEVCEKQSQQFVLLQLFEIIMTYDLSDEVGRKNLQELIMNTLMSNHCSTKIVECVVTHFEIVIPDVNKRLDILANIISEIRLPLKEPATQIVQITEEQEHQNNMQKAKLRLKLIELKDEEYQAIQERNYVKADSLKEQLNVVNNDLIKLCEQPEPDMMINDDIREEKNDSETMIKCLSIISFMMKAKSVKTVTPTLRSLMNIAFTSLDHPDDAVHILSLEILGMCCLLDKDLAKKHIMTFFLQFSLEQENQGIWLIALKAIFDLLLFYGLEYFEMVKNVDETSMLNKTEKSSTVKLYSNIEEEQINFSKRKSEIEEKNHNLIKVLTGLLDTENQDLRTTTTEGLCKLLLNRRISSSNLLSRFIIMCYNPINDDDTYILQCLSTFLDQFVVSVIDSHEMLEEAFLPTLKVLANAPQTSPLQEIDLYNVAHFMLNLTRVKVQKSNIENYYPHNSLAFTILAEILNPSSSIDKDILVKCLKDLDIQVEDSTLQENLKEGIAKVSNVINETDKRLLKYMEQFKKKLEAPNNVVFPEDENIMDDED